MSKINKLSKDIPLAESTFVLDVIGDVTKKRFLGEFTCKIPRRKEQCLIDKHRAFLNGDLPQMLDAATLRYHHMISYLRYTIVTESCPKFWKESDLGYDLYDENVTKELYNKVLEFEESWLKEIWGEEAVTKLKTKKDENESGEETQTA